MPAADIDRMESPTSTWAAKAGLKNGYGLSNYWSVREGFIYHGHDGAVLGGLTDVAYMPDYGVGYFYSINSGNSIASMLMVSVRRTASEPTPVIGRTECQELKVFTKITAWLARNS